jgi:hypothetical protein
MPRRSQINSEELLCGPEGTQRKKGKQIIDPAPRGLADLLSAEVRP